MPSTLGLATNPHHRSSMREGVNTYIYAVLGFLGFAFLLLIGVIASD